MARMVATKAALSIRVDALTDSDGKSEESASSIGLDNRVKLESRLRALEHQSELGNTRRFSENGAKKQARFSMSGETKTYNTKADAVDFVSTQRDDPMEAAVQAVLDVKEEKKRAKEEKRAKKKSEKEKEEAQEEDEAKMDVDEEAGQEKESKKEKKEKKRKRRESEVPPTAEDESLAKVNNQSSPLASTFLTVFIRRRRKKNAKQGKKLRRPRKLKKQLQPQPHRVTRRKRRRKSRNELGFHLPVVTCL